MTIETTANRISYTGSGTTGPFSFPYYFLADGDLTVIKTTIADGTEETLTLTTDYTVSGAGEAAGGSVTLVATLSSAYKLTIIRDPDILQPADYPANDRFPAATHEEALDRATMILQRLKDLIDRSFRLSDGDVSGISLILQNLGAGKLIAVNSAGTGIESIAAADVDLATVSAFIQTLFDDADAATARTTLGAAATGANTFTGLQSWKASSDIASAATVDLSTATGNVTRITGTTAVSAWTMNAGQWHMVIADGALPLTYHATTNKLNTNGANYTCTAGDRLLLHKDNSGIIQASIIPLNTVFESAWINYSASSTIVGWSSFTTKQIYYKDIGKTRFVYFKFDGTSNSTTTSFTLPSASSNTIDCGGQARTDDNGVTGLGHYVLPANSATVAAYYGVTAAAWTASGTKRLLGQFTYQLP